MRISILISIFFCASVISYAQTVEAENGTRTGTQIGTQHTGFTGSGYVTGFDADGDKVTMTFNVNAGIYNVYVRYASPSGDKFNFVYINSQNLGSVAFPFTANFTEIKIGKVYLNKGENTIAIVKDWGFFEVDNMRIELSEASDIHNIAADLVHPTPSFEADSLYNFLSGIYGKVILSGQYGGDAELNRIKNVSGKLPVVRGFDLIDYSPSRVEHGTTSTETEKAIEWNSRRGVVTFCWHWNAPKDLIDQPGKEWWRGFYTDATNFDVTKAMNSTSSQEYTLIVRDIDVIAGQLKKLRDAKVPILWRPLHEAEGKWFWWGAKGPEACKWLWKLLYDRLVNYHQLNNLIWVWTSTGSPSAREWYPGDQYVDIIGADIYLPNGTYSSSFITFDNMVSLYEGKKIITLSENGPIPDPEKLFIEGAAWSWFGTWAGTFITDGVSNSTAHINNVYKHEYVVTLDEIDSLNRIIARLDKRRDALKHDDVEEVVGLESGGATLVRYQNPVVNNMLVVTLSNPQNFSKAVIYSLDGKIHSTKTGNNLVEQNRLEFDLTHKSSGIYLLKIFTSQDVKIFRIVKIN